MVRSSRPRIALVTSHPLSPPWDSADKHLAEMVARTLPRYRFLSVRRAGGPRYDVPGRQLPVLSRTGRPGPLVSAQIAGFALGTLPVVDLVHAVVTIGRGFPMLARTLGSIAARLGRPVLHTAPGVVDPSTLEAGTVPALGTTVVLSHETAETLRAAGFPDVRVIPPSLPLHRWPVAPRPPDEPTVLFAGHHDTGGGAETAVAAFAASAVRDRGRLVLAMRSRPGQDERRLAEGLRQLARSLGVGGRVEVKGHVSDMPALVRSAAMVILPAASLAGKADVPLVLLEAMAAGRPVVTSDLPSLAVLEPAAVRLRPDAAATARAIDEILADEAVWRQRASAGRHLVEREFGEAAVARRYADLYQELLDRSPRGGTPPAHGERSMETPQPVAASEGGDRW